MVNYQNAVLDRTFAALADPTRRALLARLDEEEGISVSDLARPFPVSLPAIMKHLDVLSDAGLLTWTCDDARAAEDPWVVVTLTEALLCDSPRKSC